MAIRTALVFVCVFLIALVEVPAQAADGDDWGDESGWDGVHLVASPARRRRVRA